MQPIASKETPTHQTAELLEAAPSQRNFSREAAPRRPAPGKSVASNADDWPCFRGPHRLGVSKGGELPLSWNDNKNVLWKRELPGPGASSPITWKGKIYLTCYSGYGLSESSPGNEKDLKRHLVCLNGETGAILWTRESPNQAAVIPFRSFRALHGYATSTPAADETGIYVMYGSSGAAAYTHEGELRWRKSLGTGFHDWGSSASPVIFDNLVIFHADIENAALIALDKNSGEPVWKVRTGGQDSWSTPCLARVDDRHELIFHHSKGESATLSAVDPRNGTDLWSCRVLKDYLCPSPIVIGGVCYVLAHGRGGAVRLGGRGDVTSSHLKWTINKGTEVCTPLYHDGHLYWAHQSDGIAYCVEASTGRIVYEERIRPRPGLIYASGVLAGGRIYYVSRENGTFVVAAEPKYRLLAHNTISADDSIFNATPAISRGNLLLRSNKFLYCIGQEK